jgi:hypothetical protein
MQVEKVIYTVNWRQFKRGSSFFVPCLDCDKAREEILQVTDRLGFEVLTKRIVVDGIQGLRVWRL